MDQKSEQSVKDKPQNTEKDKEQDIQSEKQIVTQSELEEKIEKKADQVETRYFSESQWIFQNKKKGQQNSPCKRWGHSVVLHQKSMIIYGGHGQSKIQKNWEAIYKFDCQLYEWEKIIPSGPKPQSRDSHSSCCVQDVMYVFGGSSSAEEQALNDLWEFDFKTNTWTEIQQKGDVPGAREGHSLIYLGDKYLLLIGGLNLKNSQVFNDTLSVFDITTNTWKQIQRKTQEKVRKESQSVTLINDHIYLFGGQEVNKEDSEEETYYNDLFKIKVDLLTQGKTSSVFMKKVEYTTSLLPSARCSHSACAYMNRYLIVVAGEGELTKENKQLLQEKKDNMTQVQNSIDELKKEGKTETLNEKEEQLEKLRQELSESTQIQPKNDIMVFDTELNFWFEINASFLKGVGPFQPRFAHTTCIYKDQVIVFGGMFDTQEKLDDLMILQLKDTKDTQPTEEQVQNSSNTNTNLKLNQNPDSKFICQNCNLVYGLTDWLQFKATTKQEALTAIQNQPEKPQNPQAIENQDDPNYKQSVKYQQALEYLKEDDILKEELRNFDRQQLFELQQPEMSISFFSSVTNFMPSIFQGFGLILDACKLIKTSQFNINLFQTDAKLNIEDKKQKKGEILSTQIDDKILGTKKLYFQLSDNSQGYNPDQFCQFFKKIDDIHQNVDIDQDEDDQNFTEEQLFNNYCTLFKLGLFRIGESMLVVSKNKEQNIISVGYISCLPQNNPDVNQMIYYMFILDLNTNEYLSENGRIHKQVIIRNIQNFMGEDYLLNNHDVGNHFYILDLKKIPTQKGWDYEFQYNPKENDIYIKSKGIINQDRQKIVQNLVDYSLKNYLQYLYIDQTEKNQVSITFNGKLLETKNYREDLENLVQENYLTRSQIPQQFSNLKDYGNLKLYMQVDHYKKMIEQNQQYKLEENQNEDKQEIKKESQDEPEIKNEEQEQEKAKQGEGIEIEEENKKTEENSKPNEEIVQNTKQQTGMDIEVVEEEEKVSEQKVDKLYQQQQGVLVYFRKRLICRAETQHFGDFFIQKVLRKALKSKNKDRPYYLRNNGIVQLSELFTPNIVRTQIESPYFLQTFFTSFKTYLRIQKAVDRKVIIDDMSRQLAEVRFEKLQKDQSNQIEKEQNEHKNQVKILQEKLDKALEEQTKLQNQLTAQKQQYEKKSQEENEEQQNKKQEIVVEEEEVEVAQNEDNKEKQQEQKPEEEIVVNETDENNEKEKPEQNENQEQEQNDKQNENQKDNQEVEQEKEEKEQESEEKEKDKDQDQEKSQENKIEQNQQQSSEEQKTEENIGQQQQQSENKEENNGTVEEKDKAESINTSIAPSAQASEQQIIVEDDENIKQQQVVNKNDEILDTQAKKLQDIQAKLNEQQDEDENKSKEQLINEQNKDISESAGETLLKKRDQSESKEEGEVVEESEPQKKQKTE